MGTKKHQDVLAIIRNASIVSQGGGDGISLALKALGGDPFGKSRYAVTPEGKRHHDAIFQRRPQKPS